MQKVEGLSNGLRNENDPKQANVAPIVRQRSSRNATSFNTNDIYEVPTPGAKEVMEINEAQPLFSRACKRISRVVVYASLYIVLFSSNGMNLRVYRLEQWYTAPETQEGGNSIKLRRRRSPLSTSIQNQIPIPHFDMQSSSADDSVDDSDDDVDDGKGSADNAVVKEIRNDESLYTKLLGVAGNDLRKKLPPALAYAKNLSSPIPGAPKPKHNQEDIIIYHYHNRPNEMIDASNVSQKLELNSERNTHNPPLAHARSPFHSRLRKFLALRDRKSVV